MQMLWRRFTNRDRLSYVLVVAFGLSLLMVTLQFQFGSTVITTPGAIIELDQGYITESRLLVRIIEGVIAIGMIILGTERLARYKNKEKERVKVKNKTKGGLL